MKREVRLGFSSLWLVVLFTALCTGCHKNEKLDQTDALPVADGDEESDGDAEETPAPHVFNKLITAHQAALAVDSTGTVYAINKAGLLAFHPGALDDATDDQVLIHHEFTLENWPLMDVTGACADQEDNVWFSTKNGLFLFLPQETPFDPSDDVLVQVALDDALPTSREILTLFCNPKGPGVLASTSFGFLAVVPGADKADASTFLAADYNGSASPLASRPYAATLDADGVLWSVLYSEDGYKLHAVKVGAFQDTGDDQANEVPFGFADAQPTALATDGTDAIWINNGTDVWHLTHGGSLGDATDDVWTQLPTPSGVKAEGFQSLGSGLLLAVNMNDASFGLVAYSTGNTADTADDHGAKLPKLGFAEDNRLLFAAYQAGVGLWYSTEKDFALMVPQADLVADGVTVHRFSSLGNAPGNNLPAGVVTADGVYLGGTASAARVTYDADTSFEDFAYTNYDLNQDDNPPPFDVKDMVVYKNGVVVAGAWLAYLSPNGDRTLWNGGRGLENSTLLRVGPDDLLWVNTYLYALASWSTFNVYDPKSVSDPADDKNEEIDTDYFGKVVGQNVDALAFVDGCKALVGNILGLFLYDCHDTPMDPDDDTATDLSSTSTRKAGKQVKALHAIGDGKFWMMTVEGLNYLDLGATVEDPTDDVTVLYDVPGPSICMDLDESGRLYYFITDALVIHDTKGTPDDPSDDEAATIALPNASRQSTLVVDHTGGLWIGLGDVSGLIHLRLGDLTFLPLAEAF